MTKTDQPDDAIGRLEKALHDVLAQRPLVFRPAQRDPDDSRLQDEPPPSSRLRATFKWEETANDGEDVGPLLVFNPDEGMVIWESPDWLRRSEAEALAHRKGWKYSTDD